MEDVAVVPQPLLGVNLGPMCVVSFCHGEECTGHSTWQVPHLRAIGYGPEMSAAIAS